MRIFRIPALCLAILFAYATSAQAMTNQEFYSLANSFYNKAFSAPEMIQKSTEAIVLYAKGDLDYEAYAYAQRGRAYSRLGMHGQGELDCFAALKVQPGSLAARQVLSEIYEATNQFENAALAVQQIIDLLPPENADVKKNMQARLDFYKNKGAQAAQAQTAIDANSFFNEFKNNQFAAEEKYSGKRVLLRGKIGSIGSSFGGAPQVTFEPDFFQEINCEFPSSAKGQIAGLQKGAIVTIACELKKSGKSIITMHKCEIVQ